MCFGRRGLRVTRRFAVIIKITGRPRFRSYNASQRVSSKINALFVIPHVKAIDWASSENDKAWKIFAEYYTHACAIKYRNCRRVIAFVADP